MNLRKQRQREKKRQRQVEESLYGTVSGRNDPTAKRALKKIKRS